MNLPLYDFALSFWQAVLDEEMNYHMGHFLSPRDELEQAMNTATENLLSMTGKPSIHRVLDVGCGWGGPAFYLSKVLNCEVVGMVLNRTQADFVNKKAFATNYPVKAIHADAQEFDFKQLGKFDLIWIEESLEHMEERQKVLTGLHSVATRLALAGHCRNSTVAKAKLHSEFFGIPSVESKAELLSLLQSSGWETTALTDCTELVLPSFTCWQKNLKWAAKSYPKEAEQLLHSHTATQRLYHDNQLHSIQLTATPRS